MWAEKVAREKKEAEAQRQKKAEKEKKEAEAGHVRRPQNSSSRFRELFCCKVFPSCCLGILA